MAIPRVQIVSPSLSHNDWLFGVTVGENEVVEHGTITQPVTISDFRNVYDKVRSRKIQEGSGVESIDVRFVQPGVRRSRNITLVNKRIRGWVLSALHSQGILVNWIAILFHTLVSVTMIGTASLTHVVRKRDVGLSTVCRLIGTNRPREVSDILRSHKPTGQMGCKCSFGKKS